MHNIFIKEAKLSASFLSYLFIFYGLMFFLPGFPILCGVFFVTLGLYYSFQAARESNDIIFSALLPIAKREVVKGKYLFVCFIEACALALITTVIVVRMTILSGLTEYLNNALMNANLFALGAAFFIFGLFNWIFVSVSFKTAINLHVLFIVYTLVNYLMIAVFESLHHLKGLEVLNAFGTEHIGLQITLLIAGMAMFVFMTLLSYRRTCKNFEKIDL